MSKTDCSDVKPIDRDVTPSGWWDVHQDAAGTWRAEYAYGDDTKTLYGFATFAEASRATWGNTPECDNSGDTCPAPGHGTLRIEVI